MVDKKYCMSSYLAFRYIEDDSKDFYEGLHHRNIVPISDERKTLVDTAEDIDVAIQSVFSKIKNRRLGLMLSGGMDSAILASYMSGQDAYTFRFLGGSFQNKELQRAEQYADYYNLKLHYVDIDWSTVETYLDAVMKSKAAPVHSIEPQILQAALQAKSDGIEVMVVGASSDLIFGGMDQLLSQDWTFEDFMNRYIFTEPSDVLKEFVDMKYLFERYRRGTEIDFLKFMQEISLKELTISYSNAFNAANILYIDPYSGLKMASELDLYRVRKGESKYLIRDLFNMKYPDIAVPDKVPMPRPVDAYFEGWDGPERHEFRDDLDIKKFTGNQKWQIYCLERFLNMYEPES